MIARRAAAARAIGDFGVALTERVADMGTVRWGRAVLLAWACCCAAVMARAEGPGFGAGRFEATRARPLFSPTRRPPPPPVTVPAEPSPVSVPPPAPPPDLTVSGIIIGGGTGAAIVRHPADASATRITLGGQVDGWTVTAILPRSIVLRRDGRSVTLELRSASH